MTTKYTDEELDALIAFGEPYNREGDVAVLNALTQLKEAREEIQELTKELISRENEVVDLEDKLAIAIEDIQCLVDNYKDNENLISYLKITLSKINRLDK